MTSKVFFFAVLLIVLFGASGFAQIKVGPRVGLNASTVSIDAGSADKPLKPGVNIGGAAMIHICEEFSVQPGLLFSQKGLKIETFGLEQSDTYNYLEVRSPFYYKLDFLSSSDYYFQVGAGPYIGALLSDDNADLDNSIDVGATISAEVVIPELGPGDLAIQPGCDLGLINVSDIPNENPKNLAFTFSAIYFLDLPKF